MKRIGCIVLLSALTPLMPLAPAAAQDLLWTRQAGTERTDVGLGVAVDKAGSAYVTGYTKGSLGGPGVGSFDYFLAKYDASGAVLWTRQTGTSEWDFGSGVAVDNAGNAYITGRTLGSLGGPNAGEDDAFVAKYDALGTLLWTRQLGTPLDDLGLAVAVDGAGNAYITGYTVGSLGGPNAGLVDAFLAKFGASGTLLWTRQLGTSTFDEGYGVAVDDAGNAYITGQTLGSLGGPSAGRADAFVAKYDASGTLLWTRQLGTPATEQGRGVALDIAGNAYITGSTTGSLGGPIAGSDDVFLAKFSASGTLLWTRQLGTSALDEGRGVAVDDAGNAYITGTTLGSFAGPSAGGNDVFLAKFDASGTLLWTRQTGTSATEQGRGVALDIAGNAYIAGWTSGSLGGPNAGGDDYFLAKYGEVPCYADCDQATGVGVLDIADFLCFQNNFVNSGGYACDCDTSTGNGVCDVFDFLCFQDAFVNGCP